MHVPADSTIEVVINLVPACRWLAMVRCAHAGMDVVDQYIAWDEACPTEILAGYATRDDKELVRRVAAHPNTPAAALQYIARQYYHSSIMTILCERDDCPADILTRIYHSPEHWELRGASDIPLHSNCTPTLLRDIANDQAGLLKVVYNPHCPADLLQQGSSDPALRKRIATNPNCSTQLRHELQTDPDPQVRIAAARNPQAETSWLLHEYHHTHGAQLAVLANPHCPASLLHDAVHHGDADQQLAAANNPHLPERLCDLLGRARDPELGHTLIRNPACTTRVLNQAVVDLPEGWDLQHICQHPNASSYTLSLAALRGGAALMYAAAAPHVTADILLHSTLDALGVPAINSSPLEPLGSDVVSTACGLARGWRGTIEALISSAGLLGAQVG